MIEIGREWKQHKVASCQLSCAASMASKSITHPVSSNRLSDNVQETLCNFKIDSHFFLICFNLQITLKTAGPLTQMWRKNFRDRHLAFAKDAAYHSEETRRDESECTLEAQLLKELVYLHVSKIFELLRYRKANQNVHWISNLRVNLKSARKRRFPTTRT